MKQEDQELAEPAGAPEPRLLSAPGRGIAAAVVLTTAAGGLLAVAFAAGWLASVHTTAHAASTAPSPVQLLWRLFLAVAVIAVLARTCGVLARRAGQPEVLGEIVAGLILGPTVLDTLVPGAVRALLPAVLRPNLSILAQAGLMIFMFSVGLEVDRGLAHHDGKAIFAASQAMMVVPFTLGLLVSVPLFGTFGERSAAIVPYAIFVGTTLSVTAFPVLARIVQESGLQQTSLGSMAMLSAAVCDVLAWCALAVALAMIKAQSPWTVIRMLALTGALCVVMLLVMRPLLAELTSRYAGGLSSSVRLVLVIGIIFGLGAVTDKIGVHDIFGGFLAGLVLPRDTPALRPVTRQLSALNRTLLLPVFFVSIGLQVNLWHAVTHSAVLAGGALLLLAAIAGKLGGTAVVASAGGMPRRSALGLAALMNARGVTDIVVISAGLSAGLINDRAFTVLVMMALITTAMAGPALHWLGLWQTAARPDTTRPEAAPPSAGQPNEAHLAATQPQIAGSP